MPAVGAVGLRNHLKKTSTELPLVEGWDFIHSSKKRLWRPCCVSRISFNLIAVRGRETKESPEDSGTRV